MNRVVWAAVAGAAALMAGVASAHAVPSRTLCSSGYVDGIVGGEHKCLHAGEFCSTAHGADYVRYGFTCVDGRLQAGASTPAHTPAPATTSYPDLPVLFAPKSRSAGCRLGALPDRRCSPGAYSKSLTKAVICSATFRTSSVRNVTTGTRHLVEQEYGLAPASYGRTLEIDHIVSLELGGSNTLANLFPERATLPNHQPGYRVKDRLENAAHAAVCNGTMALAYAQRQIASNWELLYQRLFGAMPSA